MNPQNLRRACWMLLVVFLPDIIDASAATLSDIETKTAVAQIEATIKSTYVAAELRAPLTARLERSLKDHHYDELDPAAFAKQITEDLNAVAHDGHLYLTDSADEYAAMRAPPNSSTGLDAFRRAAALRDNSGLTQLEILPGNVRYLRLEHFQWVPKVTKTAYDDAARFLKDGDAIVIDLRGNGGGESDAADYFPQVFLPPDPDPVRAKLPASSKRDHRWQGKPIYLLVDGGVGSAAEAVAYGAQQEKTAVIVGAPTYGAANNNKKFAVPPQFVLSVSYNRPINPISGTNWEGVGVQPDIAVAGDLAFAAAQTDALWRLNAVQGTTPERLAEYEWARIALEARLHPVTLSAELLRTFTGRFETISLRMSPEGLRFSRSDRPKRPQDVVMIPLNGKGLFEVPGYDDLRARVSTNQVILLHGAEDAREVFQRTQQQ